MYQYRVVPVGRLDTLARRYGDEHVTNVGDDASIEQAVETAIETWASEGWRLHTCQVFDKGRALLVFEKWDAPLTRDYIEMG